MLKSIVCKMLTSAMGLAWDLIKAGERVGLVADSWGVNDLHVGLVERLLHRKGVIVTSVGERLELGVNRLAMGLGYDDGAVSGLVAWPEMSH